MRQKNNLRSRSFSVDITVAFALLIAVIVSAIIFLVYSKSKKEALRAVAQQFKKNGENIIIKTRSYLDEVEKNVILSTVEFRPLLQEFSFNSYYADFLLQSLKVNPQVALIYYGNKDGDFFQAGKRGSGYFLKKIDKGESFGAVAEYLYLDRSMSPVKEENKDSRNYDPRIRPWYKGAIQVDDDLYWTEPYVFFESGLPGITVSRKVDDDDGNLKGVVGADILLDDLSSFLRDLELTPHEMALIVDGENRVLAYTGPGSFMASFKNITHKPNAIPLLRDVGIPELSDIFQKDEDIDFFSYVVNGKNFLGSSIPFNQKSKKNWRFIIAVPEDDFFADLKKILNSILLLASSGLVAGIFITWLIAKKISTPIEQLCEDVEHIKNFDFEFNSEIKSRITEIVTMNDTISAMKHSLKAFSLYVPKELVKKLIAEGHGDISVGGHLDELTIFFTDIANFTSITEKSEPHALMKQLSEYFEVVTNEIEKCDGTVDKFIGDAVMAFWGAPVKIENHAELACRAALSVFSAISRLNDEWEEAGKEVFLTRIGVHSDIAIVGNLGSSSRMNYSILGDGVNLASRLEGVNKVYGTNIVISESTYEMVKEQFICRKLDKIAVKGKDKSVTIFELLAEKGSSEDMKKFAESWNLIFDLYLRAEWDKASALLKRFIAEYPEDDAAKLFHNRIQQFKLGKTPLDWTGVFRMKSK